MQILYFIMAIKMENMYKTSIHFVFILILLLVLSLRFMWNIFDFCYRDTEYSNHTNQVSNTI